jgi:hypothetical protein
MNNREASIFFSSPYPPIDTASCDHRYCEAQFAPDTKIALDG